MARIYWLSKTATDREADAAIALSKQLPDLWAIVCNKFVFTSFQRRFELDMVIVGDHGVYVLDEKSWRGPVTCDTEYWRNARSEPVKSPIQNMENASAVLGTQLRKLIAGGGARPGSAWYVDAFVLFSRADVHIDMDQCPAPDRIIRLADAAVILTGLDAHHGEEGVDLRECRDAILQWLLGGKPPTDAPVLRRRSRWAVPIAAIAAIIAVIAVLAGIVVWRGSDDAGSPKSTSSSPIALKWRDAHNHVGEYAVVEGPVMDVERSPKEADPADTYFNVGKVFVSGQSPDSTRFYFFVPSAYDHAFRDEVQQLPGNPATPRVAYAHRVVRVTGRIEESGRGEPYIEVHSTDAIAVVE